MRSEIKYHRWNFIRRRWKYIVDWDGKHRKKNLEVRIVWVGVSGPEEFFHRVHELFMRPRGPGAPLRYGAWEITAHPADKHGARRAFRSLEEMLDLAHELLKQMHGVVALIGCHGLQDLHILILNDGITGLGLKSYLPNRSNPRRVMVAVIDRIEREINEKRALSGYEQMTTMKENREEERRKAGNAPLLGMLLERVSEDGEPSIADLLKAFRSYGWKIKVKVRRCATRIPRRSPAPAQPVGGQHGSSRRRRRKSRITKFTVYYKRKAKSYDLDLLHRELVKRWWERFHQREKERTEAISAAMTHSHGELTNVSAIAEAITDTVHRWTTAPQIPPELEKWLRVENALPVPSEELKRMAEEHPSDAVEEMFAALSALQDILHGPTEQLDKTPNPS